MIIRTLIVDDEAPARAWLKALCRRAPDIHVVGEADNAPRAASFLKQVQTDLVLLDIQLGPANGFHVLDGLPCGALPNLIFVTAHDEYAVRAFEHRALDYLLKPVHEERFLSAIDRVRRIIKQDDAAPAKSQLNEVASSVERALIAARPGLPALRLIAERDGCFRVIQCKRIVKLVSDANYVDVFESGSTRPATLRGTLVDLMQVLDHAQFLRANRSTIINIDAIDGIQRDDDSRLVFVLKEGGERIRVGRAFQESVQEQLRM